MTQPPTTFPSLTLAPTPTAMRIVEVTQNNARTRKGKKKTIAGKKK